MVAAMSPKTGLGPVRGRSSPNHRLGWPGLLLASPVGFRPETDLDLMTLSEPDDHRGRAQKFIARKNEDADPVRRAPFLVGLQDRDLGKHDMNIIAATRLILPIPRRRRIREPPGLGRGGVFLNQEAHPWSRSRGPGP